MVYVFLAEGFEEIEALATVDILRRCGVETLTVGIGGEAVTGVHGITVIADIVEDVATTEDVQAIVLPGGLPGTINLKKSATVAQFIDYMMAEDRLVCAICAAPSILGERGLLDGRKATCYPNFAEKLGKANYTAAPVTVDGNIITGKAAGAAEEFAFAIAKKLVGIDKVREVKSLIAPIGEEEEKIAEYTKKIWRKNSIFLRKDIEKDKKIVLDEQIFKGLVDSPEYKSAKVVLCYVSMDFEVDTKRIIEQALLDGKKVAVPLVDKDSNTMEFYFINSPNELVIGEMGILQPSGEADKKATDFSDSICIVPGLAFDEENYRLGFGGGYYDRFLAEYNGVSIGLSYIETSHIKLPRGKFDRAVDLIICSDVTKEK